MAIRATFATVDDFAVKNEVQGQPAWSPGEAGTAPVPAIVAEEESLLRVVLARLDKPQSRSHTPVDDAATLIELRDALAEAKPEDQGPLLEQMHRIEALSRQRGKGDSPPVDRRSPYFGHLRLLQDGRRRDVLIGQRGYVEPGGGVQIVDWRHAPVSRLYYRYDEGDTFEERLGEREVEGEILARRTVTIVDAELRRVASAQGIFSREPPDPNWRSVNPGLVPPGRGPADLARAARAAAARLARRRQSSRAIASCPPSPRSSTRVSSSSSVGRARERSWCRARPAAARPPSGCTASPT